MVCAALFSFLAACSEPAMRAQHIPPGIKTGELLFHRFRDFECGIAVWQLDRAFADDIVKKGLVSRDAPGWKPTPVPDDMSKETANLLGTWDCLRDSPYGETFETAADSPGNYYLHTADGGTDILVPAQDLLLIGSFE